MIRKAAGLTTMVQPGMFHGEDAMKEVYRYWEMMSNQKAQNVFFTQKRSEVMRTYYELSECFADLMRFPKKLSGSFGLSVKYERMSLQLFMA